MAAVTDLADATDRAGVVVDCAGLRARELAPDPSLTPVRGQVVVVDPVGLDEWVVADEGETLTYVVPASTTWWWAAPRRRPRTSRSTRVPRPPSSTGRWRWCLPWRARGPGPQGGPATARPSVRLDVERRGGRTVVHC